MSRSPVLRALQDTRTRRVYWRIRATLCHHTQVAASTASSAGEEPFPAIGSADFDSMRLAIRGYLDIQYVGSVPYYSLLFQQNEVGQRLQPTNPVGERKLSVSSYAPQSARRCRENLTAEEDRLLRELKETEDLPWENNRGVCPEQERGNAPGALLHEIKSPRSHAEETAEKGKEDIVVG